MRIGITVNFQHSFFSAGSPQTCASIAEVYRIKGHEVVFIQVGEKEKVWWDDIKEMAKEWPVIHRSDLSIKKFDLIIEVGNHLLNQEERKAGRVVVWFCRKPLLYHDIEASLFPFEKPDRSLDGVSEVWMVRENTTRDDIQYAETLFRLPVKVVPFLWTPSAAEFHRQELKAPVWPQIYAMGDVAQKPWSIHISETNNSSASSCTIPLLIMREVRKKTDISLNKEVKIHNADNVKQSEFFRGNVLAHTFSDITDMSGAFIGRQRIVDLTFDPKCILISHSRFSNIRPYVLDAMWVGIPLVHNLKLLADRVKGVAELGYYPGNELIAGREAFARVVSAPPTIETLIETRKKLIEAFSPLSSALQDEWNAAALGAAAVPTVTATPHVVVGFCDMWDSFNPEYNMFTLMMNAANIGRQVVGKSLDGMKEGEEKVDLLIFGPFGDRWKTVASSVPKVHYTGENTKPIKREDVKLNIGFEHMDMNDGSYLRMPLWMLEINWFRADPEKIGNPKPLPINRCCKVYPAERARHEKFCAFVVTNPRQPMRNSAFQWLSSYKHIDSAGRLFNNVGDVIFAGLGGGGGELKKLEFLKNYKFCLAYENDSSPGYVTEKLLHAKAAGCIPIYWGDPKVERDFDVGGFIDARQITTSGQLVRAVKEVDEDEARWVKMYNTPAIDEVRRDMVRRTLSECARRLWSYVGVEEKVLETIPRFLGFTEDAEEDVGAVVIAAPPVAPTNAKIEETIMMTGANQRFLSSLQIWLQTAMQMKEINTGMQAVVYLMADVSKDVEQTLIEAFPSVQFKRFPSEAPVGFSDLWEPQHFAWKIWLMREAVKNPAYAGKLIFYLDSGAVPVRWPTAWLKAAREYGMCVLADGSQFNRQWCHEVFVEALKVTEEEKSANQIWAGAMAFVAGHELATVVLEESWGWAQKRAVIMGPKWSGMGADGRPFGHRHDQSILSIVCRRRKVPAIDLDGVYSHVSLRHTFLTGRSLYVHRGMFQVHAPVADGIDEPWIINLDRRKDRLDRFKKTHPGLADRLMRLSAFEGTKLELTPRLARLFKPHDFGWKKPIMGCALSHLALWMQLANEKPEVNTYLILEDDARLSPEWQKRWEAAVEDKALPEGWDLIYLGGILPPNREGFEQVCVEKVNQHIARVAENNVFGQNPPNRYFHFCAYAYVLTRRGAAKVIEFLRAKDGYWTSADHMMCNIHQFLNIYFLHPLVAGCYQDDDPVYQKSAFNDFSRVDSFDSDLWNNKERFSEEQVKAVLKEDDALDIPGALEDARKAMAGAAPVAPTPAPPVTPAAPVSTSALSALCKPHPADRQGGVTLPQLGKRRIVTLEKGMDSANWMEYQWLKFVFGTEISMNLDYVTVDGEIPRDEPIVLIQRSHSMEARKMLMKWTAAGAKFYILHLSDEYGTDPIDFYSWPSCLGVIRNYAREDLQESEKVRVIPLGYHRAITMPNCEPYIHTPRPPFRELVWSFTGTKWHARDQKLEILKAIPGEHMLKLVDTWESPERIGREESLAILLNSWFVPCPRGQNPETFRFYEALEAGAVPILVKEDGMQIYFNYLGRFFPLLIANDWRHAAELMYTLKAQPQVYEQYRGQLLAAWQKLKGDVRGWIKQVYAL
jgi:GR25 family glycosyltransferase involved in LPS biosynthesis